MKLNKRNCSIRFKLTPYGADFLQVIWEIGGDHHVFYPSAVMGSQFNLFVDSLFSLYDEGYDSHTLFRKHGVEINETPYFVDASIPEGYMRREAKFYWDQEGSIVVVFLERTGIWGCPIFELKGPDPIKIRIETNAVYEYTVDGRELCYAVAKACTKALKSYGIWGYYQSTAHDIDDRDHINIGHLLFIKAYALDVMEVRELKWRWKHPSRLWPGAEYTSFEKEMELLQFDM